MAQAHLKTFTRVATTVAFASADRLRLYRQALALFDRLHLDQASLREIKRAMHAATRIDDEARVERYAKTAMYRFPENSAGYLAAAERRYKSGDFIGAEAILIRAPRAKQVQSEIERIRRLSSKSATKALDRTLDNEKSKDNAFAGLEREVEEAETGQHAVSSVDELVTKARRLLLLNPLNAVGYELLARAYTVVNQHDAVVRLLSRMPNVVKPQLRTYMLLSKAFTDRRDHRSALGVLLAAQKFFPHDRRILLQISGLYRDDGQAARAYTFVKAAQSVYPVYGSVRCLTFQADHGFFEDAEDSLDRIGQFTLAERRRFLPMINRVSTFFPSRASQFAKWRQEARKSISTVASSNSWEDTAALAIRLRWLSDARTIVSHAIADDTSNETANWLVNIERSLGPMLPLVDIASSNEMGGELVGVCHGVPVRVDPATVDLDKVVEVFIPTAFFADREEEKPSYSTVRDFLLTIYIHLLDREDLIILPRQQYNWRHCRRALSARAVSYHTNSDYDEKWLHIQETPLAARCSLDHKGFAGYSSVATDFEKIDRYVESVPSDALTANYHAMYDAFVNGNVSKYNQPESGDAIEGDYVFIAMQIPTDIVAALARISGVDLVQAVAHAYAGSGTRVIVKRHPYCNSMTVQSTLNRLAEIGLITLSDGSIHDLIRNAKAVFTVNSGVGLEALLHMKPVVVTGDCDYRYGVAAAPTTIDELLEVISAVPQVDEQRVLKFLYFYNKHYAINKSDSAAIASAVDAWLNRPIGV